MIRLSTILPVVVGLVAGVFAVVAGLQYLEKEKEKYKPKDLVPLVVAKAEIPYGAAITVDMLGTIEINKLWIQGSHSDAKKLVDRVASTRILVGMPVTDGVLAPVGTPAGAENQIPIGHSLVTVMVKSHAVQNVDPGNRVDVMHTEGKGYGRGTSEPTSRYIVQNVKVFSVGARRVGAERPAEPADGKKARQTKPPIRQSYKGETPVTLLVPRDNVMKLTSLASSGRGEITLLLRRVGDVEVYANPALPDADLVADKEEDVPPPPVRTRDVVVVTDGIPTTKTFLVGQLITGQGGAPTAAAADRYSTDEESQPKPLKPLGD